KSFVKRFIQLAARARISLFVVLPLLMLLLSLDFKRAQGAYWEASKVDPSYSYLIGALAYATGQPSMCCFHPGVTVQTTGAWMLRATHAVIGQEGFVQDILRDPEVYAAILGFAQIVFYAV